MQPVVVDEDFETVAQVEADEFFDGNQRFPEVGNSGVLRLGEGAKAVIFRV